MTVLRHSFAHAQVEGVLLATGLGVLVRVISLENDVIDGPEVYTDIVLVDLILGILEPVVATKDPNLALLAHVEGVGGLDEKAPLLVTVHHLDRIAVDVPAGDQAAKTESPALNVGRGSKENGGVVTTKKT